MYSISHIYQMNKLKCLKATLRLLQNISLTDVKSAGIPEEVLIKHPEECIRIPMKKEERSLNLSNSAAIILYEALRQLDFPDLEDEGELHRLEW